MLPNATPSISLGKQVDEKIAYQERIIKNLETDMAYLRERLNVVLGQRDRADVRMQTAESRANKALFEHMNTCMKPYFVYTTLTGEKQHAEKEKLRAELEAGKKDRDDLKECVANQKASIHDLFEKLDERSDKIAEQQGQIRTLEAVNQQQAGELKRSDKQIAAFKKVVDNLLGAGVSLQCLSHPETIS